MVNILPKSIRYQLLIGAIASGSLIGASNVQNTPCISDTFYYHGNKVTIQKTESRYATPPDTIPSTTFTICDGKKKTTIEDLCSDGSLVTQYKDFVLNDCVFIREDDKEIYRLGDYKEGCYSFERPLIKGIHCSDINSSERRKEIEALLKDLYSTYISGINKSEKYADSNTEKTNKRHRSDYPYNLLLFFPIVMSIICGAGFSLAYFFKKFEERRKLLDEL